MAANVLLLKQLPALRIAQPNMVIVLSTGTTALPPVRRFLILKPGVSIKATLTRGRIVIQGWYFLPSTLSKHHDSWGKPRSYYRGKCEESQPVVMAWIESE